MTLASNDFAISQSASVRLLTFQKARNRLTATNSLALQRVITASAASTISMLQQFNKVGAGISVLSFTQTSNYMFSILAGVNRFLVRCIVNLVRVRTRTGQSRLILQSTVRRQMIFNQSVTHTLTLTQEADLKFERAAQNLTLTQTAIGALSKTALALNQLNLTQAVSVTTVYNRLAVNVFQPLNGFIYTTQMNSQVVTVDAATGTLIRRLVVLETAENVITLPRPNLADTENYDGSLLIKRSINGVLYTYVKKVDLFRLKYTWTLGRTKSLELRHFVSVSFGHSVKLLNWKGETWLVNILSSPAEMIAKSQWGNDGERVDVTIEFEGFKIS